VAAMALAEGGGDSFISSAEGRRRPGGFGGPTGPVGVGLARSRLGQKQLDQGCGRNGGDMKRDWVARGELGQNGIRKNWLL
jgi:hypothetical protein